MRSWFLSKHIFFNALNTARCPLSYLGSERFLADEIYWQRVSFPVGHHYSFFFSHALRLLYCSRWTSFRYRFSHSKQSKTRKVFGKCWHWNLVELPPRGRFGKLTFPALALRQSESWPWPALRDQRNIACFITSLSLSHEDRRKEKHDYLRSLVALRLQVRC